MSTMTIDEARTKLDATRSLHAIELEKYNNNKKNVDHKYENIPKNIKEYIDDKKEFILDKYKTYNSALIIATNGMIKQKQAMTRSITDENTKLKDLDDGLQYLNNTDNIDNISRYTNELLNNSEANNLKKYNEDIYMYNGIITPRVRGHNYKYVKYKTKYLNLP